jgi:hypothetical protein
VSSASTTPVTPAATSGLSKDVQWIITHFVSLILIAALALAGIYGVESLVAKHDEATNNKWQQVLTQVSQDNSNLRQQLTQDEATWAQQNTQAQQTITQLAQSVSARNTQSAQQQKVDVSLDAQQAAARLAAQTSAASGEVTVNNQNNDVDIDLPIARRVVANLDLLPVVQANLADTQKQLTNETTIAQNNAADADKQKQLVTGLTTQLTDAKQACDTQIKAIKAEARKGKIKAFFGGVAAVLLALAGHAI